MITSCVAPPSRPDGRQLGYALGGAFAPTIAQALVEPTGTPQTVPRR